MKRTLLTLCGLCTLIAINMGGCEIVINPIQTSADDEVDLSPADVAAIGKLTIDWENGAIDIQVDETATELSIKADRRVGGVSVISAEEALDDWNIRVIVDEDEPPNVTLRFNKPSKAFVYRANLQIVVPTTEGIFIENDNGDIDVDGNAAKTVVDLSNGDVTITNQTGNTTIETDNGRVEVDSLDGDVEIQTDNGRITVDAANGSVTATAENGQIQIDSAGGNVDAETDNGEIEIAAQPLENGFVKAYSSFGRLTIRVPADFAADLTLETEFGAVDADLSDFETANVVTTVRKVTAELNGGGGLIRGQTELGGIDFDSLP